MSWLALSSLIEYLCSGTTVIINSLLFQILRFKVDPRAVCVNVHPFSLLQLNPLTAGDAYIWVFIFY